MSGRPAHAASSWAVVALLCGAAAMRPACVQPGEGTGFDVSGMLANLGASVIVPSVEEAATDAAALEAAVMAWNEARQLGDAQVEKDAARDAWASLMDSWQALEVMQVGPAASSTTGAGGRDLRDEVYSWPTTNPCRVDQETVEAVFDAGGFFADNQVNVYGMDTLEYLLWHPGDNDCAGQHPINEDGTWDALSEDDREDLRASYAAVVSARVRADAAALAEAWAADGGDFVGDLAGAGDGFSVFGTELEAVNAVFDALFYIEVNTKDVKLGVPIGRVAGCSTPPCADAVESPWADTSRDHILANLRGFRALWTGGEGLGFDDLLASLGEDDVASRVLSNLDTAEAAVTALDAPLGELVAGEDARVGAAYDAVKGLADILKDELPPLLVLQVPGEAGGDND